MKRNHQVSCGGGQNGSNTSVSNSSKSKIWEEEQESGSMDELLAVLGYKVRSDDMADVAEKLEQLEMVMGSAQQDGISQLSDTVHYNPSDLSGWLQTMLMELNPIDDDLSNSQQQKQKQKQKEKEKQIETQSRVIYDDNSEYDLRAIPGIAAYPQSQLQTETEINSKRLKTSTGSASSSSSSIEPRPLVVVDAQDTGVRLVHTLLACAEAVQQDNLKVADALVKQVGTLAVSQTGAMRKVATYFAEALARRIYRVYPQEDSLVSSYSDILQMHFYETCPYLKFAHFTANQAILEAFATATRVHVVDFGLKQGMQWPALMQALALRPGGPPVFRLTGVGPPQPDNTDALQQVGWKLAQFAETMGVEFKFEFRGFVANSLADLEPSILDVRPPEVEALAVNSVFELHCLLARPGAIEKVMASIKAMNPKIVTMVEQEANHNGPVFLDRFNESLHYYSSLFDSLEGSSGPSEDLVMSEVYLGRQICNVVACDGGDRVERHETLTQWRNRLTRAGFEPVHLGSNVFKQAQTLLALYAGGGGYQVEENNGSLTLGWHTRPLIATSAWQLASPTQ